MNNFIISIFALCLGTFNLHAMDGAGAAQGPNELWRACAANNLVLVKKLIDEKADVNAKNPSGKTVLHVAVETHNQPLITMLLANDSDVHAATQRGFTPLHVAAQHGYVEAITALVGAGANINSLAGTTPLHEAAAAGHREATLALLSLGAVPSIKDSRYNLTAANLAHENRHSDLVEEICLQMSYQQKFVQNINYVIFNWMRAFSPQSPQHRFLTKLSSSIKNEENADELFRKVSSNLKTEGYTSVKGDLKTFNQTIIANMKAYNQDKVEAAARAKADRQDQ